MTNNNDRVSHNFKLDPEELNKQPEEVFDTVGKLGEGSYGAVYKAVHRESGQTLAVKKVPVETDLQEIIKEISIMQQCDSPYVVKYYGSYFKNADLWIVMEYCGAGSVSDIMRLRRKTLTEKEIGAVMRDTLQGLHYLHERRKIHRDVKAGNILLNCQGHAKLADFGVAGQLTDTMAKRNTVIGTPFWMAPEVIQEIGYDTKADIWSLCITGLEMAEGRPPRSDIHPMRAIFMIPTRPPPTFTNPEEWSAVFNDFICQGLVKKPEDRKTSTQLLQHPFIRDAASAGILEEMISDAEQIVSSQSWRHDEKTCEEEEDTGTMVRLIDGIEIGAEDEATLVRHADSPRSMQKYDTATDYSMRQMNNWDRNKNRTISSTISTRDSTVLDEHFQEAMATGNYDFLADLPLDDLVNRRDRLESDMDIELEELRRRYQTKRQPILDAIEVKKQKMVQMETF